MARAGEVLDNPVTRERLTFLETAADTGGELLRIELVFAAGGFVAAEHVHPNQDERIEVVSGTPATRVAGRERIAHAGEIVDIPAGTPHRWWNAGDDDVRAIVELRPALRMESLFEALAVLARDGRLNPRGFPDPLRGALLAREFKDEIAPAHDPQMPFNWLPLPVLDVLLRMLAAIARVAGYRVEV
jgi:quercetin dioxygenase-like cupin family protein